MGNTTDELNNEILRTSTMSDWKDEKKDVTAEYSLAEYLAQMLELHAVSKREAISRADVDTVYGYQIFQGKKHPGRNILLRLALGLTLTVDETKRLLYYGNTGTLYPRVKRDAYLMYALHHQFTLAETNSLLYENGEAPL